VPVDVETTAALVAEIKRLIDVVGGLVLKQALAAPVQDTEAHYKGIIEGVQKLFDAKRAQPAPVTSLQAIALGIVKGINDVKLTEQPAPVQEPDAYMYASIAGPVVLHRMKPMGVATAWCVQAQLENDIKVSKMYPLAHSVTPLYTTPPAQPAPAQGPVGYFSVNDYGKWEENENEHGQPLYTTPPAQRQWVGLTDDEIFSVLGNLQRKYNGPPTEDSRVVFALAIEAKLKEKNT
jgi:hypothetical protein